jgi:protein involved in polysaccharide export with SLBB domain
MRTPIRRLIGPALGAVLAVSAAAAAVEPGEEAVRRRLREQGLSEEQIAEVLERARSSGEIAPAPISENAPIPEPAREILEAGEEPPLPPPPPPLEDPEGPEDAEQDGEAVLPRFGQELFALAPESFAPPLYGPIDPDYRIGPGDDVVVDVWGDAVFRLEKVVNREGNVLLPDVGQVSLMGLTLTQAKDRLRGRLSKAFSGFTNSPPTTFLDVSLGKLRPIKVFVVGEVRRPGGYDLSAASTVFHALYYAGGPAANGSMRDVRVIRGNRQVAALDVYDYLLRGTKEGDIRLENDDTIFVPVLGRSVSVRGEVVRPGVYELTAEEDLGDVIRMAGGLTATAYLDRVSIERIVPPEERDAIEDDRMVIDVGLLEVLREGRRFELEDLDDLRVQAITDSRTNYVEVSGQVRRPGTYELTEGMRVSDVVRRADGPRDDAFLDRAVLSRTHPDLSRETITFDLDRALEGIPEADLLLRPRDEIRILSIWDLRERETVAIQGAVREPGQYELTEGMLLGDLLLKAGGFLENAHTAEVEVSRPHPDNPNVTRIAETFHVEFADEFPSRPGILPSFELENHDIVFVRTKPYWGLQRNVRIEGEVLFPGTYSLRSSTETLADLIDRAGGLLDTATPEGFQLIRTKDDVGQISVDLDRALRDRDDNDNVVLVEGDILRVPPRPTTVKVSGAVNFPTNLVYRRGKGISYYVDSAGGYRDAAKKGDVAIIYPTGRAAKVRRFWFDPGVKPGAEIVVPARGEDEGVNWGETIKDVTTILASLATTYLVIDRIAE